MSLSENAPKYSKDAPFTDPVVRCDSCQVVVRAETIRKLGMCPDCGNRRVKNVLMMKPEEMARCKEWGVDPEWIALFHEVNDNV